MKNFLLVLFVILSLNVLNAQSSKSWGVSAAVQETTLDLMFPIWTGSSNVIAPSLGLISIGGSSSDLRLGLTDRFFLKQGSIMPFIGARGGVLLAIPKEGDSVVDYVFGLLGGGEYFFSENFSAGVEAQLNFSFSNEDSGRFGNPGETNINTASVIYISVYF